MFHLSTGQIVLWGGSLAAKLYLVYLIARNWIWRDFPVFSSYFTINVITGLLIATAYILWGTQKSWSIYWGLQAIIFTLRVLVSVEVWRKTLKPYPGIWALAWKLLATVGILGLLRAGYVTFKEGPALSMFYFSAQRHLEFASVVTLFVFLLFCRYYGVSLEPAIKAITVGLCFFSIIQVLNASLANQWKSQFVALWRWSTVVSFDCSMVIWWWGLRAPVRATAAPPALYPAKVYVEVSPQVNDKLRALNKRLEELLKP
jgi:hypothetical protein